MEFGGQVRSTVAASWLPVCHWQEPLWVLSTHTRAPALSSAQTLPVDPPEPPLPLPPIPAEPPLPAAPVPAAPPLPPPPPLAPMPPLPVTPPVPLAPPEPSLLPSPLDRGGAPPDGSKLQPAN